MNKGKVLLSLLVMLFGSFMFVFGGYDDSPGAQLLGIVLVATGIVILVKNRKKTSK